MRICRRCPFCPGEVRVMKTFTPVSNPDHSEKLQLIQCVSCKRKAQVSVISSVTWLKPALVSTDPLQQ